MILSIVARFSVWKLVRRDVLRLRMGNRTLNVGCTALMHSV